MTTTTDEAPGIPPDVVARIKGQHAGAELHELDTDDGPIVVRSPSPAEYAAFVDEREKAEAKAAALHNFALGCIVWPEKGELAALVQRRAALTTSIGNELLQLAGIQAVKKRKKL